MLNSSLLPEFLILLNRQNICDKWLQTHKEMHSKYWTISVASLVICIVNIITNSIAFAIFYQDKVKSVLNKFLIALSASEVLFQILYIIHVIIEKHLLLLGNIVSDNPNRLYSFGVVYLGAVIPLLTSCHIIRNWFVVMISLYRFEKLVRAFSNHCLMFPNSRVSHIIAIVVGLSALISFPRIIERNVFYCRINNSTYFVVAIGMRALTIKWYRYAYSIVTLFIFQNGGPIIIVCVVSSMLINELRYRHKIHCRLKQSNFTERSSVCSNNNKSMADSPKPTKTNEQFLMIPNDQKTTGVNYSTLQNDVESNNFTKSPRFSLKSGTNNFPLHREKSHRRRSYNSSIDGSRLVVILCISFVVFETPIFLSKLSSGLDKIYPSRFKYGLELLSEISNFATIIDSFFNFFIYLLSNKSFRNSLRLKWKC